MATFAFWLTAALITTHELDAMRRHEWRLLPLISRIADDTAQEVFVWAHVPLTILLIWIVTQGAFSTAAIWLSAIAIIHVALHWAFRRHPKNEFNNLASWMLIAGAGITGTAHIFLVTQAY